MHSKTFKEKYEQLSKFSEIILRGPYVVSRGLYLFRFSSIHHHFLLPTRISVAWCSQDFQGRRSANFFCLKTPTYLVAILNFDILTASCYVPDKNSFRLEHRWKKVRKLSVGKSKMDASNNQHFSHTRHENPTQISKHWRYTNKYRSN